MMKYINIYKNIRNMYTCQIHSEMLHRSMSGPEPIMVDRREAEDNLRDQESV